MTQKQKIRKMEKLFDKIVEIFPDNRVNLTMFSIDMKDLPKDWKVEEHSRYDDVNYFTAKRSGKTFDITLFK